MAVSLSAMSSTINPAGIKDDKRKLLAMTLILSETLGHGLAQFA